MANSKQRQALATTSRLTPQVDLAKNHAGFPSRAVAALEEEAARIVAEDAEKRLNGGTSLHIVGSGGVLSGFIKDANTTVRFAGGSVAVTTHE